MADTFPYVEDAGTQGLQEETVLFPQKFPTENPPNVEEVSTQAAIVQSQHTGKDYNDQLPQTSSDVQATGLDEVRRTIAATERDNELKSAEQTLRQSPSQESAQYFQEVLDKHRGPPIKQAMEQAVVDIITPQDARGYFTEFNRNQNAKDLAARNIIYDSLLSNNKNASTWDKALAIGRDVIGFVNPRAINSAVAEALGKNATWGGILNPQQVIQEFRDSYLNADPTRKTEMVQALIHGLERTSSFFGDKNAAQVAQNLQKVLGQSKGEAIETTLFDSLNLPIATTASTVMRALRFAKDFGKPANVAIRAGNPELAAGMMAGDALKKTQVSGMTTDEIARAATSMDMTPMELSLTNLKVNQQLQDKLVGFAQKMREDVRSTLMPSNITPVQIAKGAAAYDDLYSAVRNKAIYDYHPDGYKDGAFTGSVKWQARDGAPFMSRDAAEQFGKDNNKVGTVEVVGNSYEDAMKVVPGQSPVQQPGVGWIFHERVNNPLPLESIGAYDFNDVAGRNFWNFKIPMFAASWATVKQAGLAMSANARIRRVLEGTYKSTIKDLGLDSRKMVNKALIDGDALSNAAGSKGYVFNSLELGAQGLGPKEQEAYYKLRLLRDNMWLERNRQMVYEFKAQGMRELAFEANGYVGHINTPAKPLDIGSIKGMNTQGKVGKVLNTVDGTSINLTNEALDKLYASGGSVLRFYKPQVINGRKYTHILVDADHYKMRDITTPLPYRPGEFARSYTDEYFITHQKNAIDEFDRKVGNPGYEAPPTQTLRTAPNEKEAKLYTAAHNDAVKIAFSQLPELEKTAAIEKAVGKWTDAKMFMEEVKKGEITPDSHFDFHYNRESRSYLQDTIDEGITNGRLFYSKRGEKLLSTDPSRQNMLDIAQSLGVELANISRFITSKDIRVDAIERWMNAFGHGLVSPSHNKMADFTHLPLDASRLKEGLISEGSKLADLDSAKLLRFAESERDYIKRSLHIRTQADKTRGEMYRKATEWIQGKAQKVMPESASDWLGTKMRQTSVPDFLRKANFVTTLAVGNVAQLVVQANGMMIAAARHPIFGLAAAKTAPFLRMAMMSDNPNVWKTVGTFDSLTSLGLRNVDEFVESVKALKRSGILDDIKSTALFNVEDGALDLYKGMASHLWDEASPFFFNRGEEMSRLTSWEVARREWIKAHPTEAWTTDNALRDISARQKEYNLGMQSYNTAVWQHGWQGIPLQFLQYNVKLGAAIAHTATQFVKDVQKTGWKAVYNFDNGAYRGFNPAEALSILGTQIVLYGVAGNSLRSLANELWSDESGMSEEQKMYISEGLAGGLIYSLTKEMDEYGQPQGAKLALGNRLGSFNWYGQIWDKISGDKTPISDFLLGATKSNGVKLFDIVGDAARLFYYSDVKTPEVVMAAFARMPEIFASYSNALKAYTYMQNEGIVVSKDGSPIARINAKENLAAFIGISTVQVQEYYEDVKDENKLISNMTELSKHIHKVQLQQWQAIQDGDRERAEMFRGQWNNMMPTDPGQRQWVMDHLKEKVWPGDTATDRIRREFIQKMDQEVQRFRVMDKGQ